MNDERLVQLTKTVSRCAELLEDAERAVEAASANGVELKTEWRRLIVSADVEGDPDAITRVGELESGMSTSQLHRERAEIVRNERQNRLRAAEAALERYHLYDRPMNYFKRRPGGNELFGPLTNWAMGLAGRVPAGDAAGAWEPCSEDRAKYELRREAVNASEGWRLLRAGELVKLHTVELKAEPA